MYSDPSGNRIDPRQTAVDYDPVPSTGGSGEASGEGSTGAGDTSGGGKPDLPRLPAEEPQSYDSEGNNQAEVVGANDAEAGTAKYDTYNMIVDILALDPYLAGTIKPFRFITPYITVSHGFSFEFHGNIKHYPIDFEGTINWSSDGGLSNNLGVSSEYMSISADYSLDGATPVFGSKFGPYDITGYATADEFVLTIGSESERDCLTIDSFTEIRFRKPDLPSLSLQPVPVANSGRIWAVAGAGLLAVFIRYNTSRSASPTLPKR